MKKITFKLLFVFTILLVPHSFSCAADTLRVVVSIVPQKYFVEKIGKSLLNVSVMVLPGASPVTYEPKPRQMSEMTRAKIFFAIGVPFEKVWLKKIGSVNPGMKIVHTEDGINKMQMPESHHHHDEEEDHDGINDPHIWLSPALVKIQARNILDALVRNDASNQEAYISNYDAFIQEINVLDDQIRKILFEQGQKGFGFMVYHPSWGYFANAYGLKQIPIEMAGKEPKARDLQSLIRHARQENVKAVLVQPQFSAKSANTIADAIGCKVMIVDPLAENWAENLLKVAESLKSIL